MPLWATSAPRLCGVAGACFSDGKRGLPELRRGSLPQPCRWNLSERAPHWSPRPGYTPLASPACPFSVTSPVPSTCCPPSPPSRPCGRSTPTPYSWVAAAWAPSDLGLSRTGRGCERGRLALVGVLGATRGHLDGKASSASTALTRRPHPATGANPGLPAGSPAVPSASRCPARPLTLLCLRSLSATPASPCLLLQQLGTNALLTEWALKIGPVHRPRWWGEDRGGAGASVGHTGCPQPSPLPSTHFQCSRAAGGLGTWAVVWTSAARVTV